MLGRRRVLPGNSLIRYQGSRALILPTERCCSPARPRPGPTGGDHQGRASPLRALGLLGLGWVLTHSCASGDDSPAGWLSAQEEVCPGWAAGPMREAEPHLRQHGDQGP